MNKAHHLSITIDSLPQHVYQFASNPLNLPLGAVGLTGSPVRQHEDVWLATAPFGEVKIRFVCDNCFGVMDHHVELASGEIVYNPMRVVPNGNGSEVIFTLLQLPTMSAAQLAADKEMIAEDLLRLKELLER